WRSLVFSVPCRGSPTKAPAPRPRPPPVAAPAPGWPTAAPMSPPAAAPPRAPTPAPFSRVLSGPPAHPAAKSVPARRNIEALLIHFMFMVVSILVFPFYLSLCLLRRVTARLFVLSTFGLFLLWLSFIGLIS